eukprot:7140226-Alexandrium_andersonii.AAC.1
MHGADCISPGHPESISRPLRGRAVRVWRIGMRDSHRNTGHGNTSQNSRGARSCVFIAARAP